MEVVVEEPISPSEQEVAPPEQPAVRSESAAVRWTKRILTALVLLLATAIVLGLAAVTIGPRIFPYQALVVRSGSMEPTIKTGSIVFYRPTTASQIISDFNHGKKDIIVFNEPGQANTKVTHRVYAVGNGPTGQYFETKGDANGGPDPWRVPAVGKGWKAVWWIPTVGYVLFDIQSTYGRLLLLLVPAGILALITLWEIWEGRKEEAAT